MLQQLLLTLLMVIRTKKIIGLSSARCLSINNLITGLGSEPAHPLALRRGATNHHRPVNPTRSGSLVALPDGLSDML